MTFSNSRKPGFTLLEVLLVVALSALVVTIGVAPVMRVVRNVVETERIVGKEGALRMTARRIVGDMQQRCILPEGYETAFRIVPRSKFGDVKDDVVIFWSSAPLVQGEPVSSVVYGILRESFLGTFGDLEEKKDASYLPEGLYRWFLPGLLPQEVDPESLPSSKAQLVLPRVDSFRVEAHDGSTWINRYEGDIPLGVHIEIGRPSESTIPGEEEFVYEDWFPR